MLGISVVIASQLKVEKVLLGKFNLALWEIELPKTKSYLCKSKSEAQCLPYVRVDRKFTEI